MKSEQPPLPGMPSTTASTPTEPLPPAPPTARPAPLSSLVASAQRLSNSTIKSRKWSSATGKDNWQEDAWDMYDLVGEQRFLATTLAGRLAQAKLYIGQLGPERQASPEPVEDENISSLLDYIGEAESARAQMIYRLGLNLFLVGEGWLVGVPSNLLPEEDPRHQERSMDFDEILPFFPEGTGSTSASASSLSLQDLNWFMLSTSEVSVSPEQQKVTLRLGGGNSEQIETDPDSLYLIRVWRPHPRRSWEADSPTRSSLPVLRELVGLTMHISAQVDSRLAGAGLLMVPQSAIDAIKARAGLSQDSTDDPFTDALLDAMLTPISDRSNASALVPLVVGMPDEAIEKVEYLTFAKPLDTEARTLRDEAIRRLALGQDAPPELLLGVGGMNHWGAWLVREDVVTTHLEPPLALICDALTTQYLWPVLEAMGMEPEEYHQYVIWYNVDHMIMRPNRSSDAMSLHDKGALSDEALREAAGFDESDAPPPDEEEQEADLATLKAIDLVRALPDLMRDPGLPALVEQVRSLMFGAAAIESSPTSDTEPEPEPDTAPDEDTDTDDDAEDTGENSPNDGLIPNTDGDDMPEPREDLNVRTIRLRSTRNTDQLVGVGLAENGTPPNDREPTS